MFRHKPSLKALRAFEAAARHTSFAAAGELLFRTVHRHFQELDSAIAQITPVQTDTPLPVSVSTYFVTRWLSPRLGNFLNAHPNITVRLQRSVNDPDFSVESSDIAIRWGNGEWPNSQSELLISLPMIAVCSPQLSQANASLESVSDLQYHRLLRDQISIDYWAEWLQLADAADIAPNGPVIVDPNVRVQSAIDAQGITLANPLLQSTIDSGLLYEPFNVRLEGYGYYIVYSDLAGRNPNFKLFRDWLMDEIQRM